MIAIIDYGMGNLRSVQKAFEAVGHPADVTSDPDRIRQADKVILPGVGAFADAIAELRRTGLGEAFIEAVRAGQAVSGGLPRPPTAVRGQRGRRRARGAGPAARPGRPVRPRSGPEDSAHGLEHAADRAPGPDLEGPRTRAIGLLRPLVPRHRLEFLGRRGRERSRSPLPCRGVARKPDGLPVSPREEPADRAGDVREFRLALTRLKLTSILFPLCVLRAHV